MLRLRLRSNKDRRCSDAEAGSLNTKHIGVLDKGSLTSQSPEHLLSYIMNSLMPKRFTAQQAGMALYEHVRTIQ